MVFMSACELLLELDTLEEVNEYYLFITNHFSKFGVLPRLDGIVKDKEDKLSTLEKIRYVNKSLAVYRERVKAIVNGFYLGHKQDDYDTFSIFEYTVQYKLMEQINLHIALDPNDKIAIHLQLVSNEDNTSYNIITDLLSLRELKESNDERVYKDRKIVWHDPATLVSKLYGTNPQLSLQAVA
jgi:hypothetical protein